MFHTIGDQVLARGGIF